jgi:hypothetical protein
MPTIKFGQVMIGSNPKLRSIGAISSCTPSLHLTFANADGLSIQYLGLDPGESFLAAEREP